jgi:hypothetical protein
VSSAAGSAADATPRSEASSAISGAAAKRPLSDVQ